MSKTSSSKAKGRRLQDLVRDTLRFIFKDKLEDDDIVSRQMGGSGTDVVLSPAAKRLIPFAIECKNQEKLNVTESLKQASDNAVNGLIPLLIFHRNHGKVYVGIEFDSFIKLIYNTDMNDVKQYIKDKAESKKVIALENFTGEPESDILS